ncbi:potassium channel family protein [bacterium]|nr:potassium channel family protein [bacterium]MBU1676615.1 potassium channel family protein [bacterium]
MQTNSRLLRHVLIITAAVIACGTAGFVLIEGWPLFDAFYMTIITLTTIGFGEVHELSGPGRAFTLVLVVFGLGAAAAFAAQFTRLLIEGDLSEYWRRRRMERTLSRLKDHVIVCGYGRIGASICAELSAMGATLAVIEKDEERQAEARASGLAVMPGNATSDTALLSAGVRRAAAVVAALSHDADNVFVALSARDLNPAVVVIARAEDRSLEARMLKAGVNRIVCPAQLGGGRIAHLVGEEIGLEKRPDNRHVADVMGYDLKIYRNLTDRPQTLHEVEFATGSLRTLAVIQSDGTRVNDPPPTATLEEMEAAVLLVDLNAVKPRRHGERKPHEEVRGDQSVGIAPIDAEHQRILSPAQRLDAFDPVSSPQVTGEILDDLKD